MFSAQLIDDYAFNETGFMEDSFQMLPYNAVVIKIEFPYSEEVLL